jgi:hypothetical protein
VLGLPSQERINAGVEMNFRLGCCRTTEMFLLTYLLTAVSEAPEEPV